MRTAVLALVLGGCLIVKTNEVEDKDCPASQAEVLGDAAGPLALAGDQIYFIRTPDQLSSIAKTGGRLTDLAQLDPPVRFLAINGTAIYWATETTIVKLGLTGGTPEALIDVPEVAAFAVDDIGVVYGSLGNVYRLRHDDSTVETLAEGDAISGLAAYGGTYFFSDLRLGLVRRTPPLTDLATALNPAWIVADGLGVYYYERGAASLDNNGAIRLVPPDGGAPPVTTTESLLSPLAALALDETDVYFATETGRAYGIRRVSRFGGPITTLACGEASATPIYIVLDQDSIYWSDTHHLYRLAKASSTL